MRNPFHLLIKKNRVRVADGGAVFMDEKFKNYQDLKKRLKKLDEKYG